MEEINSYTDTAIKLVMEYAPKFLLAIVVLIVGMWVINNIVKYADKAMQRSSLSLEIRPFIKSLIGVILKVLLLFSVAGMVGIETTSFIAVLSAAVFAIGMALQGSLGNLAAGVMILIFRPYKVGDLIQIEDDMGYVQEIQIFNTIITTLDNKTVIIPNGTAISGVITNLSTNEYVRVDINVAMPYNEDFPKVQKIILDALKATDKVLDTPAPTVGIETFDTHFISLALWPYAKTDDYWDVYFEASKNVKAALGKNGIKMAYSEGVELGDIGL